ncbi:DUF5131 family protein [Rhizobium skierniewicense]|uniref:DUF5131 family protein n=1 Tax=Rhizobium skierniewicense TaxID=984260 RepID=UPI00157254E8|nr:phage Gp37/Gp68 family protein [Rhizobium skierniewicense]NTF32339.1 phage Gp37/Gp68 family protein [Rhizobium skierniewicense]
MADKTSIEWTDATWNPITGCSVVSPGCTNCYAMKLAGTRLKHIPSRKGLTVQSNAGPVWNGQVRFNEEFLLQPLSWKKPRMIFVCAHGDLFAEGVPDEWIDKVFAVMALAPQHTFQVLTKRAQRMRDYLVGDKNASNDDPHQPHQRILDAAYGLIGNADRFSPIALHLRSMCEASEPPLPLPNVWLGVSVEDQPRADERIPFLSDTPAAVRWISAEPLLGGLDLERVLFRRKYYESGAHHYVDVLRGGFWSPKPFYRASQDGEQKEFFTNHSDIKDKLIDWVVAGGESGPGARPMHPAWPRSLRDQCEAAGVPFFFKQWGNWASVIDRDNDDPDWRADYSGRFNNRRPDIAWLNREGGSGFHGEALHVMKRVAKGKAGRILDGVTHDAFPTTERFA